MRAFESPQGYQVRSLTPADLKNLQRPSSSNPRSREMYNQCLITEIGVIRFVGGDPSLGQGDRSHRCHYSEDDSLSPLVSPTLGGIGREVGGHPQAPGRARPAPLFQFPLLWERVRV